MDDYDAMNRYSSQYEAQLDPFTAFSAKVCVRGPFLFEILHKPDPSSYPTGSTH